MENVEFKVEGKKLIITIPDITAPGTPSVSSGKTRIVASSRGAVDVPEAKRPGFKFALNVTVPNR